MELKTYDPKKVILAVGGVPIGGYADGTFIMFERTNNAYEVNSGADSEVARVKSNDKTAAITVTLMQTSNSNDVFSGIALLDERANAGVVPILLKEIGATTTIFSGACWVRKTPSVEFSKEISSREWILDMAETEAFIGGNTGIF